MNMAFSMFTFLLISTFFISGSCLDCTAIPQSDQVAGKQLKVPNGATMPVVIPANFNCTYTFSPPAMVYARIQVENKLKGLNDVIIVRDDFGVSNVINSRSNFLSMFTVFPNTTTTVQVTTKSVQMNSMFLLNVAFEKMATPVSKSLEVGTSIMNYRILNETQIELEGRQLITYQANDKSIYRNDIFDNFYVVDGDFYSPTAIRRLADFNQCSSQCYRSQTNQVTIVGLDEYTDESSVFLMTTPESDAYQEVVGITLYDSDNYWDITNRTVNFDSAKDDSAYMILSKDSDGIMILGFSFTEAPITTSAKAVAGPPNSASKVLVDFTDSTLVYPIKLDVKYFSIIFKHCSAKFTVSSYYNWKQNQ